MAVVPEKKSAFVLSMIIAIGTVVVQLAKVILGQPVDVEAFHGLSALGGAYAGARMIEGIRGVVSIAGKAVDPR